MAVAFHIENFGCRAARADGEALGDRLRASGHREGAPDQADVVVVNTCSVTAEADREARAFIRRANRRNPSARVVVTGCYAQRAPEELALLPGVAAVVGNSHKSLAPEIVEALVGEASRHTSDRHTSEPASEAANQSANPAFVDVRKLAMGGLGAAPIWADDRFAHSFLEEARLVPGSQTRPNLKIQEGCGNRCTFCVIPQTRGGSRSLAEAKVLAQVRGFIGAGGKELVLSGINLGRWGRDLRAPSAEARPALARLLRRIFTETALPRLRLSSIEPMDWDAELMALMREFGGTRLARHAHLPLQSGSDSVLRRMHRRYRPWHYEDKVHSLFASAGPDLTLGADVMVGFPGETEAEFSETVEMIRRLPFGYLHLFPFSPRPGTPGWELHRETPVPAAVTDERMAILRALAQKKTFAHRSSFVGRTLQCITLNASDALRRQSSSAALTENFLPIQIDLTLAANQLLAVRVTDVTAEGTLLGAPL